METEKNIYKYQVQFRTICNSKNLKELDLANLQLLPHLRVQKKLDHCRNDLDQHFFSEIVRVLILKE